MPTCYATIKPVMLTIAVQFIILFFLEFYLLRYSSCPALSYSMVSNFKFCTSSSICFYYYLNSNIMIESRNDIQILYNTWNSNKVKD